jgi:FkbM family methyltransferase
MEMLSASELERDPEVQVAAKLLFAFARAHPEAFFVQIGANDGVQHDLLAPFVRDQPWRGIMVEPVPYVFERLRRNQAGNERVALENAAIAGSDDRRHFYCLAEVEDPSKEGLPSWYDQIGSFDRSFVLGFGDRIPDIENRLVRLEVPCLTFESLCRKHGVRSLDLLLIDAEGQDGKIICGIDFSARHPRLLIYEHLHLPDSDRELCEAHLRDAGYELRITGVDTWCLDTGVADSLTAVWREVAGPAAV